jgi:hypothetical protein
MSGDREQLPSRNLANADSTAIELSGPSSMLPAKAVQFVEVFAGNHYRLEMRPHPLGDLVRLTFTQGSSLAEANRETLEKINALPRCPDNYTMYLNPNAEAELNNPFAETTIIEFIPVITGSEAIFGGGFGYSDIYETDPKLFQAAFLAEQLMLPVDTNLLAIAFGGHLAGTGFPANFHAEGWVYEPKRIPSLFNGKCVLGRDGEMDASRDDRLSYNDWHRY